MKKVAAVLVALALLVFSVPALAQEHNASIWAFATGEEVRFIPWYVYSGEDFSVDARYNLDGKKSGAVFVGKGFGDASFSVTPHVGAIVGEYDAISTQVNVFASSGDFSVFVMNQWSEGLGDNSSFLYHLVDFQWRASSWLSLGVDEQIFYDLTNGGKPVMDIGPVAEFRVDRFYLKVWPTFSPTGNNAEQILAGIGVRF